VTEGMHVLVVDDEVPLTGVVGSYLEREGFTVSVAHSGPDAVDRARQDQPVLIVLDVMLPGFDGIEACRQIRQLPGYADVPILMVTAAGDIDSIAQLKDLEVLALAGTRITGAGIAKLSGMTRLNELNVMNCTLLDEDLETFLTNPNLRIVYAEGCNFSDAAVEQMKYRFPMLAIFR